MSFLSKEPFYIGIESTTTSLRIALLKSVKGIYQLLSLKELSNSEAAAFLSKHEKKSILTTLLSQRHVLVRTLQLDLKRERDVHKALPFQIEPHLPFALEEGILQTQVEKREKGGFAATVFALKESSLKEHLERHLSISVDSDAVTSPAIALAALTTLEKKERREETKYLVNIGEQETTVVLAANGKALDQRSFPTEKNNAIAIQRALLSLESTHPQYNGSVLLLFGKEAHLHTKTLQEQTGRTVHIMSPTIENISKEEMATFALALGAALSQTLPHPMNFRQKEFKKSTLHKIVKKPLATALSLTLLSLSLMIAGGYSHLKERGSTAQQKMESLLHFCKQQEENALQGAHDYERSLSTLEKKLTEGEKSYTLEPLLPQVSEVLSWLSGEIGRAQPPLKGLVIDEFTYTLVNRPTPLIKNERYQVDVELLFSAPSPNVKEAFEDLLEKATFIVDADKTIQVSFLRGKGRAHFTLRDKTRYG